MRTDILEYKDEILKWISQGLTKAEMCRRLQCKQTTFNSYLKKMGIVYGGNQGAKGKKSGAGYIPASYYLGTNVAISSSRLKEKLIHDGLKERKCESCGLSEWQGKPIALELHHINGNHYDNTLSNLQILCPNCHSLTYNDTNKSIGTKKITWKRRSYRARKKLSPEEYALAKKKAGETTYRLGTGRKVTRPSTYEIFKEEMEELHWNYCAMGRKYGVSDNTIRKWEKNYQKYDMN